MSSNSKSRNEDAASIQKPGPIFIGRWTAKVLFSLKERHYRHAELRRNVGNVSQRMLTRTLRNLEAPGLITPRATRSREKAFEYSLTRRGKTIIAPLRVMCRRAKRYTQYVSADVHLPKVSRNVQVTSMFPGERRIFAIRSNSPRGRDLCAQYASQTQQ